MSGMLVAASMVVFFVLVFTAPWPEEEASAQPCAELAESTSEPETPALETSPIVVNALPLATAGCLCARNAEGAKVFDATTANSLFEHMVQNSFFPKEDPGVSRMAHLLENFEVNSLWFDVVVSNRRKQAVLAHASPARTPIVSVVPSNESVVSALNTNLRR